MDQIRNFMSNPIVSGAVVGLVVVGYKYLEAKLSNKDRPATRELVKSFILTFVISVVVSYFIIKRESEEILTSPYEK